MNEVLNYARVEMGAVRYDIAPVDVAALVAAVEPLVRPQLGAKRLALTVGAEAGTPPPLLAAADADKMRQILLNLLSNAAKFTEPDGQVDVAWTTEGDVAVIRVRDTGHGIAADKLGAIFEPFVQVDASLTRRNEGTGLGLAISRDLARAMGGDLTVESEVGEGSTFTLTLPRA